MPKAAERLQHYKGERPIFDLYAIDEEIAKALGRRVELKSGGYLIIDQTEALTTVDVNTGGYVGARNFEDTIFKTNLEAANGRITDVDIASESANLARLNILQQAGTAMLAQANQANQSVLRLLV
jgi:Rne/Rng family ribonuclease